MVFPEEDNDTMCSLHSYFYNRERGNPCFQVQLQIVREVPRHTGALMLGKLTRFLLLSNKVEVQDQVIFSLYLLIEEDMRIEVRLLQNFQN